MEKEKAKGLKDDSQMSQNLLDRLKKNRTAIVVTCIVAIAVIVGIFIYFFISTRNSQKADEQAGKAEVELMREQAGDSLAHARRIDALKEAAKLGHKSGERAKVELGILLYDDGNYQEALEYLKDADVDDEVVAAGVYTRMGDCYVNLDQVDNGLESFDKAIKKADKNPVVVPFVLMKKANVYRSQQNYEKEYETLKKVVDEYPAYGQSRDVRKRYERAKAAAGK